MTDIGIAIIILWACAVACLILGAVAWSKANHHESERAIYAFLKTTAVLAWGFSAVVVLGLLTIAYKG